MINNGDRISKPTAVAECASINIVATSATVGTIAVYSSFDGKVYAGDKLSEIQVSAGDTNNLILIEKSPSSYLIFVLNFSAETCEISVLGKDTRRKPISTSVEGGKMVLPAVASSGSSAVQSASQATGPGNRTEATRVTLDDESRSVQLIEGWTNMAGNSKRVAYFAGTDARNPSSSPDNIKSIKYIKGTELVITQTFTYDEDDRVTKIETT